jgi:hypothetical protein
LIHRALVLLLLASVVGACDAHADRQRLRPKLVVLVVLDQVGTWILDRHLPFLRREGILRRAQAEGVFHHRVVFDHAATVTAVGHAVIATGRPPRDNGIVANSRWDRRRNKSVSFLDDGVHAVLGLGERFSSPAALRVPTVADGLRATTHGRGRVVAVSMKERGAVIPGGQRPTAVYWYESRLRGFTTSRWYASALPRWLVRFGLDDGLSRFLQPWRPLDDRRLAAHAGRDDAPGEGGFKGLDGVFPHDARKVLRSQEAFLATPGSSRMLLALARQAVAHERLGEDEVPDLLCISVSGTDYVGHIWGPESWEMADNLHRVDLALGELFDWLEQRGPVAMVITADHGAPPLPESARGHELGGGRLLEDEVVAAAERALDGALGAGDWVQRYTTPYLILRERALAKRDVAVPTAVRALRALPGIAAAYDVDEVRSWPRAPADPLQAAIWRSVDPERGGDVYVAPARATVLGDGTPPRSGTDHGSPWDHDTDVPVLAIGAGVGRAESRAALPMQRVAATLSALLGIRAPEGAPREPLPGLRSSDRRDR